MALTWYGLLLMILLIAQVQLSCKNKSTEVTGIAGFSLLSKMQACLHERCRQQRYAYWDVIPAVQLSPDIHVVCLYSLAEETDYSWLSSSAYNLASSLGSRIRRKVPRLSNRMKVPRLSDRTKVTKVRGKEEVVNESLVSTVLWFTHSIAWSSS